MVRCITMTCVLLALAGCGSHGEISVNDAQTLVMESAVLAAGVTASKPELTRSEIQASASAKLFNERGQPVTVYYRFYWYDARGLEMHPLERARSVTIPAHSTVILYGSANSPGAYKTRLWLSTSLPVRGES